jgi:hypothetical protein
MYDVYVSIPYDQRFKIKKLGFIWDSDFKLWVKTMDDSSFLDFCSYRFKIVRSEYFEESEKCLIVLDR